MSSRVFGNIINPFQDFSSFETRQDLTTPEPINDPEHVANSILEEDHGVSDDNKSNAISDTGEVLLETEFLINQMVEDLDQNAFEKLKEIMTSYDDVDGMKPVDFVALWNSLIEDKYPEKVDDPVYQQRVWDMCGQIDFDQDGRLTFEEFSSNLVACQRQLISSLPTYDETPETILNPSILPDKLIFSQRFGKIMSCGKPEHSAVWDVRDGSLHKQFEGHTSTIHHAIYLNDMDTIITTSADRTMIAYDARTLKKKRQIPTKVAQLCLVYDQYANKLYSGGTDSNIHIWDPETFTENKLYFKGHTDFVMDVCMVDSLNLLVSCSLDRTIKLWDTRTMKCKHTKYGHLKGITGLSYSKKFKLLVSYGCEKSAYLWNTLSTSCIFRFDGHTRPLVGAEIVEDSPELITVDTGGVVIIWNIRSYRAVQKLRPPSAIYSKFRCFCYDSYSKRIITCGENEMHFWKSMQLDSNTSGINNPVVQIRYNRVFKQVLTSVKRFLTVWKSVNGKLHKQYPVSESDITDFIILSQWRSAAVSTVDGEIKVVSLMDGTVSRSISLKDEIRGIFLLDEEIHGEGSDHILVPSLKGVVYQVDLGKEQIVNTFRSNLKNCTISGSAFSQKYNILATISGDCIEIWKILQPNYPHHHIETKEDVTMCCFIDAWNCFITLSSAENMRIFSLPSFRHLCTVRFELPFPDSTGTSQKFQSPTPLSFVHFHDSTGNIVITSTYHISVINVQSLISQCVAEIEKNSIFSKGQSFVYRDKFIVSNKSINPDDSLKKIHRGFDIKNKRLIQLQFFDKNRESIPNNIVSNESIQSSKFISKHYEIIPPIDGNVSLQSYGCIVMEHYSTTLEKLLKFQELNVDEVRWLTFCIVSAIHELHTQNIVINNLSLKSIVKVDQYWKITNLQHCTLVGKPVSFKNLSMNYSPEYATQIRENGTIISSFTHDIWCLAHILLRLTMNKVIIDRRMEEESIINMLLSLPANGPVVSLQSNFMDVTLRNVVKNTLLKSKDARWDIEKIFRCIETSGIFSESRTPQKKTLPDEENDSDEEEEPSPYEFPSLWENQPYNAFTASYDNPALLLSNITVCGPNEGFITSTCIVRDPPLILTSIFQRTYHKGLVKTYDLKGNLLGTLPTEDNNNQWNWPEVNDSNLYHTIEIPEDAPDIVITNIETQTPKAKKNSGKPKNIRSLWQDSDSDDDAIREILSEHETKSTHGSDSASIQSKTKQKRIITPKIKVSFKGRRKSGNFEKKQEK